MNLAEFPIALLADYAPKGQKTIHFQDEQGRLTVTGSDAYGLPTATDTDVIVALIFLTKLRNNFRDVKVNFSRYELIKLLNWIDEGKSYKRLLLSLNRWHGVSLVYDKCWWNNKTKRYVSANMHILESVIYAEGRARDGQGVGPTVVSSAATWLPTEPLFTFRRSDAPVESVKTPQIPRVGHAWDRSGVWSQFRSGGGSHLPRSGSAQNEPRVPTPARHAASCAE
jgi:hypothetical protein